MHSARLQVCVPLDPATADDFNPDTVPTVGSLLNELNANSGASLSGKVSVMIVCTAPAQLSLHMAPTSLCNSYCWNDTQLNRIQSKRVARCTHFACCRRVKSGARHR